MKNLVLSFLNWLYDIAISRIIFSRKLRVPQSKGKITTKYLSISGKTIRLNSAIENSKLVEWTIICRGAVNQRERFAMESKMPWYAYGKYLL